MQSLRERLLGDEKDKTLEELMEKELSESEAGSEAGSSESESVSSSQKSQDENENDEDVDDLELLEDNEESCESEFSF